MLELNMMFFSDEWNTCVYSTKVDEQVIAQLVRHNQSFWMGMQKLCDISEPLVKVLRLVDGEKLAMGYLYEAMDRAKEAIHRYNEGKGEEGFTRRAKIWSVIDERWNNTHHHPIDATRLYLNPRYSYACGFRFDAEVMDGFFQHVKMMVLTLTKRLDISKPTKIYKMSAGTFGYDMAIQDRTARMPRYK
jgi:hypothetical protein